MGYTQQNFLAGQILKASQLIAMENGILDNEANIALCDVGLRVGEATGSIEQTEFYIEQGTQKVPGAIASGSGAIAFGGQRYDKAGDSEEEEPRTQAKGIQSFAAGGGVIVEGAWSVGFGKDTKTYQKAAFVSGGGCVAGCTEEEYITYASVIKASTNTNTYETSYSLAHAEGDNSKARGNAAHAEGRKTDALGFCAHAEGNETAATGQFSHTEGFCTKTGRFNTDGTIAVAGSAAHAEGRNTEALGTASHAEGESTTSIGTNSHTEGYKTTANGENSHAGGYECQTKGTNSFAHGKGLIVEKNNGAVFGQFNDGGNYIFSVGLGTGKTARKNVLVVNDNGDLFIYHPSKKALYSLSQLLAAVGAFDKVIPVKEYT